MPRNLNLPDTLLSLDELNNLYPDFFTRSELEIIETSQHRLIPVLIGQSVIGTDAQRQYLDALCGVVEATSSSQKAWRKFVVLQQAASLNSFVAREAAWKRQRNEMERNADQLRLANVSLNLSLIHI